MNYYEGDNIGSVQRIEIAFYFDFESVRPPVLKSGRSWNNIPFKEGTGEFSISEDDTDNGIVYACSGGFFLPRMREEVDTFMRQFLGAVAVIRVTDMNGDTLILGDLGQGVSISGSGATGQNYTSENGKSYSYKIEQSYPPYRV